MIVYAPFSSPTNSVFKTFPPIIINLYFYQVYWTFQRMCPNHPRISSECLFHVHNRVKFRYILFSIKIIKLYYNPLILIFYSINKVLTLLMSYQFQFPYSNFFLTKTNFSIYVFHCCFTIRASCNETFLVLVLNIITLSEMGVFYFLICYSASSLSTLSIFSDM